MTMVSWIFWTVLGVTVYVWAAYPLLVFLLASIFGRKRSPVEESSISFVSIIIAVHNEEQQIARKLDNCLGLAYSADRLEIIVASDGSTDRTEEIVRGYAARDARIRWLPSESRVGKSGVQNLAAQHAQGDLLFFTDANTTMPSSVLRRMVDDLADPRVGLSTATVLFGGAEDAVEKGQGFYWRYELLLRYAESDLGILATGSGQALLVRRELFRPLPSCYGDDCIMPLDVRAQGYKVVQRRDATVFDVMPHTIEGELRARIRMTARNWTGTLARPSVLNPLRFPLTALGLVSHKLLRWLTPFCLAAAFLFNTLLAMKGQLVLMWWLQAVFYFSALIGWVLAKKQRRSWVFGYSFSFCLANVGFLLGTMKAFRNQKIVAY
ncbi:MAG TPA: glycosyltransferase [Candidatus Sulfotelmatobacter sp.]|nr:glycosyltransferase [Candidatus Sulfotelmatobacter sp.]